MEIALSLMVLAAIALVIGAAVLLYTGYLFVLEPVGLLKQAIHRIQGGELGADITEVVAPELVGVYPWVDASGRPFLPWSIDRSRRSLSP